jgi:nucleoside-triphosphatase
MLAPGGASRTRILLQAWPPGVGRATIVRRIARRLHPARIRGFTTEEMRIGRQRVGVRLETFDGRVVVLAHVDIASPHRVGRYDVDLAAFDRVVDPAPRREDAPAVYRIDEIGRMECQSEQVVPAVTAVLDSAVRHPPDEGAAAPAPGPRDPIRPSSSAPGARPPSGIRSIGTPSSV